MAEPQERSAKPSSVAGVKGCKGSANQLVLWSEDGRQGELSKCGEHCPDNIHRAARLRGCHEPPCARTALRRGPRARARGHLARGPRDRDARLRPPAGRVTAASRAERAEGFRAGSPYAQVVGLVRGDPRDEGDQPSRGEHLADDCRQRHAAPEGAARRDHGADHVACTGRRACLARASNPACDRSSAVADGATHRLGTPRDNRAAGADDKARGAADGNKGPAARPSAPSCGHDDRPGHPGDDA